MLNLGVIYVKGTGVRQSFSKANELFLKACNGGEARGCSNLGVMYYTGNGLKQNYTTAKELFRKACDGGDALGCKNHALFNKR